MNCTNATYHTDYEIDIAADGTQTNNPYYADADNQYFIPIMFSDDPDPGVEFWTGGKAQAQVWVYDNYCPEGNRHYVPD
ncbi:MAG: hypothetical protein ACRETA_10075 [Gammaproteobacteria bacterium]